MKHPEARELSETSEADIRLTWCRQSHRMYVNSAFQELKWVQYICVCEYVIIHLNRDIMSHKFRLGKYNVIQSVSWSAYTCHIATSHILPKKKSHSPTHCYYQKTSLTHFNSSLHSYSVSYFSLTSSFELLYKTRMDKTRTTNTTCCLLRWFPEIRLVICLT